MLPHAAERMWGLTGLYDKLSGTFFENVSRIILQVQESQDQIFKFVPEFDTNSFSLLINLPIIKIETLEIVIHSI